jgi:hypothetical protein
MMAELMLIFGSDPNGEPDYPSALQAQHAGCWAAERGEYRIAQQLLGLACALQEHEAVHDIEAAAIGAWRVREAVSRTREVPILRPPTMASDLGRPTRGVPEHSSPPGLTLAGAGPTGDGESDLATAAGSHAPQDCALCHLLIVWVPGLDVWRHSSPDTATDLAGPHDAQPATLGG